MHDDTDMPDAAEPGYHDQEPDYPDRDSALATPYPTLQQNGKQCRSIPTSPSPFSDGAAEPNYPDIGSNPTTPYPVLQQQNGDHDSRTPNATERNYPDPASNPATPYPLLQQNGDRRQGTSIPPLSPGGAKSTPWTSGPPRTYLTLSDYFGLGNGDVVPRQVEDGVEDGEHGGAEDDGVEDDGEQIQYEPVDQQTPSTSHAEPTTTTQPKVVSSNFAALPGYHALPETDTYYQNVKGPIWPPRADYYQSQPGSGWPLTPQSNHASAEFRDPLSTDGRGNERGRGRGRGAGRPRARRGWKWALKGTQHADLFKATPIPSAASGRKARGTGKRSRGSKRSTQSWGDARHRAAPDANFTTLQAKAMTSFLSGDLDPALDFALQAITMNPEVPVAHSLIEQVLTAQGKDQEALDALASAAVTMRTSGAWMAVAERKFALAGDERNAEVYDYVLRCYAEALKHDKNNCDVRGAKLETLIEMEEWAKAYRECKAILKIQPGDVDMVFKLAELSRLAVTTRHEARIEYAIQAYRHAFHTKREDTTFGDAETQFSQVDMFIGLLEESGKPPVDCIRELKQVTRWLLGRRHEVFWDTLSDDREFDVDADRRILTPFWRYRQVTLDNDKYGNGLPLDLRARLGCLRAKMGYLEREEALRHMNVLLARSDAAAEYSESFLQAAECLSSLNWYHDAIKFYEALQGVEHAQNNRLLVGQGKCYKVLCRYEDAEKSFLSAVETDSDRMDARIELARLYDVWGKNNQAAMIAHEVSRLGQAVISKQESALVSKMTKKSYLPKPPRPLRPLVPAIAKKTAEYQNIQPKPPVQKQDQEMMRGGSVQPISDDDDDDDDDSSDDEQDDDEPQRAKGGESISQDELQGPAIPATDKTPKQKQRSPYKNKVPKAPKPPTVFEQAVQRLRDQKVRVQTLHTKILELWPAIEDASWDEVGAKLWITHAEAMASEFSTTKAFYPEKLSDRFHGLLAGEASQKTRVVIHEMEALKKRMQGVRGDEDDDNEDNAPPPQEDDTAIGDFHDISFPEWHRILSQLALLYARFVNQEKCTDLVGRIRQANVFRQDFKLYNTTLAMALYVGVLFNDRDLFLSTARQYLFQGDYRSGMAYQIFAATGSMGYGRNPYDESGKMQQWTSRLVKYHDSLAMTPEIREKFLWSNFDPSREKRLKRIDKVDEGLIPGLLVTYAHITSNVMRYGTSLSYLFRALALDSDDIIVNLSIATSYITDALSRSDRSRSPTGKQNTIAQGLGFFYRYYNARMATGKARHAQEAEFNSGRIWDLLGHTYLAVPRYERALELSAQVDEEASRDGEEVENFAREAALALQAVFVAAGNDYAAHAVGEEWLVL